MGGTFSHYSLGDQMKGALLDAHMLCFSGLNSREQHALGSTSFKLLLFCERLDSFPFCTSLAELQGAQAAVAEAQCCPYRVPFLWTRLRPRCRMARRGRKESM